MHDLHAAVNLDAAARSRSQRISSIPSLSLEVVRASVELLIQHNCVYCVERRVARTTNQQSEALSASAKGKSAATSSSIVTYAYACSAHRVCQRLSYPAFLTTKWGRSSTHPHRTRKAVIRPTRDQGGGRAATNCGERTAVQPHGRRTLRVPCDGGGALRRARAGQRDACGGHVEEGT